MNQIHILTPSVIPGDAVSNDVLGMMRWFRARGMAVHAYARLRHPSVRKKVRPLRAYEQHLDDPEDILIYHHSVGWPLGFPYYSRSRNRKIVKYHNVTPPGFYRAYNRIIYKACLGGLRETRQLIRSRPELFLADSEFNAQELIRKGAPREICRVAHPFHEVRRLERCEPDEHLSAQLQGRLNLLFVGRLAPNKGQRHLIRMLGYYHHHLGGEAHLILVGNFDPGLEGYWRTDLQRELCRQRLQDYVHFTGKVSLEQLRTYYAHAFAFLCASEHEGFCVPLIEAMHYGVPIVAYAGTAVPSTLGDTGILWETPDPMLFAQTIRYLEERAELCRSIIARQKARFRLCFDLPQIERQFESALSPFLEGAALHA
jgi:glycosyltransferase involved in cell wall biosynthesis